jgi:hypothetical protein
MGGPGYKNVSRQALRSERFVEIIELSFFFSSTRKKQTKNKQKNKENERLRLAKPAEQQHHFVFRCDPV